jgi:hypothetical protein
MRNQGQKSIKESKKMISSKKSLALFGLAMLSSIPAAQAFDLGLFGDVQWYNSTEKGTANSFSQGQLDLYGTQKIDPATKVFLELVFEAGEDNVYGLDVERLNITRQLTRNFSVSWGRFHTPIGYWNTAYHHGALIQPTITRPTFLDFEDGSGAIFPTHIIGIMADGKISTGGGAGLQYMVGIGNGSSINTSGFGTPGYSGSEIDVHNVVDTQDKKMYVAKLGYKMSKMPAQFGVFALHDPFSESGNGPAVNSSLVTMDTWGAYARYAGRFDFTAEAYDIRNKDHVGNTGTNKAAAWYAQVGFHVTDKFAPYYRFEDVDYSANDPYFQYLGTPEGSRHVLDLRYDISDTNAVKLEINRFEPVQSGVKSYTVYGLQWAFMAL